MPDHGHPISSPCEPNGSGELEMGFSWVYISQTCYPDVYPLKPILMFEGVKRKKSIIYL